jgi:hypothetical protein
MMETKQMPPRIEDNAEAQRRFDAYVAAMKLAQQTLSLEDGLAAGRCWHAFLDMFLPPESPMPRSALRVVK